MNSEKFYETALLMLMEESSYENISRIEFEALKLKDAGIDSLTLWN